MAWNNLSYSCGHNEQVQLYGPGRDREATIRRAHERLCRECYRAAETARTAKAAESMPNLPDLIGGTEKQRAWAQTIRIDKLAQLEGVIREVDARGTGDEQEQIRMLGQLLRAQTKTRYWIDNRDMSITRLLGEYSRVHVQHQPIAS